MKNKIFDGNFFKLIIEKTDRRTFAPSEEKKGIINFVEVDDFEDADFSWVKTKKPLKETAFPQNEELFRYGEEGVEEIPKLERDRALVIGVRPCDARSMKMLDEVFTDKSEDYQDPYYEARRDNTILVGLACNEAGINCFCTSVGGNPHGTEGLDILTTNLGEKHHIQALSKEGESLVSRLGRLRDVTEGEAEKKQELEKEALKSVSREIEDAETLPDKLKGVFEADYWEKIASTCIGCGICTYLCPTCYCFDITDEGEKEGKRVRSWDSCQYPQFTLETSSLNPREEKYKRLRNRFYDKFQYMPEEKGQIFCVGCGRCIDECPSGIDIVKVMNGVQDLEVKKE